MDRWTYPLRLSILKCSDGLAGLVAQLNSLPHRECFIQPDEYKLMLTGYIVDHMDLVKRILELGGSPLPATAEASTEASLSPPPFTSDSPTPVTEEPSLPAPSSTSSAIPTADTQDVLEGLAKMSLDGKQRMEGKGKNVAKKPTSDDGSKTASETSW